MTVILVKNLYTMEIMVFRLFFYSPSLSYPWWTCFVPIKMMGIIKIYFGHYFGKYGPFIFCAGIRSVAAWRCACFRTILKCGNCDSWHFFPLILLTQGRVIRSLTFGYIKWWNICQNMYKMYTMLNRLLMA